MLPTITLAILAYVIAVELLCFTGINWRDRKPSHNPSRNGAEAVGGGVVFHEQTNSPEAQA